MTTLTLNGIGFNDNIADANGALWYVSDLQGWDSPDLRQVSLEPAGQHGLALGPLLYGGRPLVLQGRCITPSIAAHWASMDQLANATNLLATPTPLSVAETVTKVANVVRAGRVQMRSRGPYLFEFQVPLLAPDPRKYGPVALSALGGTVTVANAGDFESWPSYSIVGAAAGPIIITNTTTGKAMKFNGALSGAQTLSVNSLTRAVSIGGVNRYDVVDSTTDWWPLIPGNNVISYSGGGTPTIVKKDAWI